MGCGSIDAREVDNFVMPKLYRYLTRLFIFRVVLITLGAAALVVVLDFFANGDEVIAADPGGFVSVFRYISLRFPAIVSDLIPFCVLVSALVTLIQLMRSSELVAMRAAGFSQFALVTAFLPGALIVAAMQFLLTDQVVPGTVAQLRAWGVGEYGDEKKAEAMPWLREGNDIVRFRFASAEQGRMWGVTLFRRDEIGTVTDRLQAKRADYAGEGVWRLQNVVRLRPGVRGVEEIPTFLWLSDLRPGQAHTLSTHPSELSLWGVWQYLAAPGYGNHPEFVYAVWLHKKIAMPIMTVLMVLLAIPLVQRYQRSDYLSATLATGIAFGLLFLTVDGLLSTIGESGLLTPFLAAWGATLIFGSLAAALSFQNEYF